MADGTLMKPSRDLESGKSTTQLQTSIKEKGIDTSFSSLQSYSEVEGVGYLWRAILKSLIMSNVDEVGKCINTNFVKE